jgi:hypothetical protein
MAHVQGFAGSTCVEGWMQQACASHRSRNSRECMGMAVRADKYGQLGTVGSDGQAVRLHGSLTVGQAVHWMHELCARVLVCTRSGLLSLVWFHNGTFDMVRRFARRSGVCVLRLFACLQHRFAGRFAGQVLSFGDKRGRLSLRRGDCEVFTVFLEV